MSSPLNEIIANVNDFDGVFYDPNQIPAFHQQFAIVFASTLMKLFPSEIDYDGGIQLAHGAYERYGDSITGVMEWADKRGFNPYEVRNNFFGLYHRNLRTHFMQVAPHVFAQPSEVAMGLARLENIVLNGIATHGCAVEFTRPLLVPMGAAPYVETDAVFGLADSGFLKKSTHPDLIHKCRTALNAASKQTAYPEDEARNLKAQKEMDPYITTVHINNGRPLDSKPSYIDYEFENFPAYLCALHAAHREPRRLIMI